MNYYLLLTVYKDLGKIRQVAPSSEFWSRLEEFTGINLCESRKIMLGKKQSSDL
jgi:hypothetical protein